jgi:hypothetical protein
MNQEDGKEKFNPNENAADSSEADLNPAEVINDSVGTDDSSDIDNLPIESIGSYGRLEELLTDEEKENTTNPTSEN